MSLIKLSKVISTLEKNQRYAEADSIKDFTQTLDAVNKFLTSPQGGIDAAINLKRAVELNLNILQMKPDMPEVSSMMENLNTAKSNLENFIAENQINQQ